MGAVRLLRRLPDRPVYRLAYGMGTVLPFVMRARRDRVRANLEHVCRWLDEAGMATPAVTAAARDPGRLDRLVRAAFGHWVLTYVEGAMAPRYGARELHDRVVARDPVASAAAVAPTDPGGMGRIQLALHFGAVDLGGLYAIRVGGARFTAPMETLRHPLARAWFERTRGELGVDIVPLEDAAVSLREVLRQGGTVGLVADRVVSGTGTRVQLFGAPARLPLGPAVLAAETGAPIYLTAIVRTAPGAWVGHTLVIRAEVGAGRREAMRDILAQEVRAFERIVAIAPEQWATLSFPIWDESREEVS